MLGETLDPEWLRALLARDFELIKAILERHGGSGEKAPLRRDADSLHVRARRERE